MASPWRPGTTEIHRYVSLLALSFVAVHVLSMLLDTKSGIGLVQVLVPFTGSQRPLAAGLGVVALDLALAVWVTTLLRRRIGHDVAGPHLDDIRTRLRQRRRRKAGAAVKLVG